jgi:hypothetical protein
MIMFSHQQDQLFTPAAAAVSALLLLLCVQSATMRPTARYLQQHRFVVGQRPANASCLLSLIEKVG